jgi:signal transduction histidine kinase
MTQTHAQLLSLAVHEFRTPVSVVGGYLRMLQRDSAPPLNERHKKMVEDAERSCARIVALIGELNEISKLDDPLAPFPREPFDLFTLMREVVGETHEAAERGVRFKMQGPSAGAAMTGDLLRIHRALASLAGAVLREQQDGGLVVAKARLDRSASGAHALVVIANDELLPTVLDSPRTPIDERRGGLGLTLPIARRVMEMHGGELWSPPSERPGVGAKGAIVVSMPVSSKA